MSATLPAGDGLALRHGRAERLARRSVAGQTYLLTVSTLYRRPIFRDDEAARAVCRIHTATWPWRDASVAAWVLMPDQWHAVVTLGDRDSLSTLVGRFKAITSRAVEDRHRVNGWLWGRGFEGGGPQLELLRRIAHWSMKEPELEEEALLADVSDGLAVRFTRRTMQDNAGPLQVTGPDGTVTQVPLAADGPGRFVADWTAPEPGLYRLADGNMRRVLALGPAAPREFEETVADAPLLAPLIEASGGSVQRLSDGVPDLRQTRAGRAASGDGLGGPWIGVTPRDAATVTGLDRRPLLPGWAWLALIAGLTLTGWLAEGRRRPA